MPTHTRAALPAALFAMMSILTSCTTSHHATPLVIAHRGASAYLPEHSLQAYQLAHEQGADLIEPDVVMTADNVLICSHDLWLETVTDAADKLPGRQRDDDHWYAIDLTLAEIKSLERGRPGAGHRVATLEEAITLIQQLNDRSGRNVGIIPEIKHPKFHADAGRPIEKPLLDLLARRGYTTRSDPAILQSFDLDTLRRLRNELACDLRLSLLTDETILDDAQLAEVATIADVLAPNRKAFEDPDAGVTGGRAYARAAQAHDLRVFTYTFRNEPDTTARFFNDYAVDGIFTDTPDVARAVVDQRR